MSRTITLLAVAALSVAALSVPALADDRCAKFEPNVAFFQMQDAPIAIVAADDLAAVLAEVEAIAHVETDGATRAFIVQDELLTLVGVEVGGCLLPPIWYDTPKQPVGV